MNEIETLTEWRGLAEDGAAVSVTLPDAWSGAGLSRFGEYTPPFGLIAAGATEVVSGAAPPELVLDLHGELDDPTLTVDGRPVRGGWNRLESELGLFAAEHLVGRIAVHAGVAMWDGRCVVMPGPSFAGKSTLCSAFADAGATVLSDEYAVVDCDSGLVHAWARPMRMRREDGSIERRAVAGGTREPIAVDVVAALQFREAGPSGLAVMSPAEIAVELMANTVNARREPELSLRAAVTVARRALGLRGDRGEAHATVADLLGLAPI